MLKRSKRISTGIDARGDRCRVGGCAINSCQPRSQNTLTPSIPSTITSHTSGPKNLGTISTICKRSANWLTEIDVGVEACWAMYARL
jgi:hypothetical protein